MNLQDYIGGMVVVNLYPSAKDNKILTSFFKVDYPIVNTLKGIEEVGLWLEGYKEFEIYVDEDRDSLPDEKTKIENRVVNVLVRWEYINGIFVFDEENAKAREIGFNINKFISE